ncbi:condensation domain-containing protein, partial [Streptomyces sp. T-3]|nr:condensation domain-containing protein [Streptomyces sp. T-3]
MSKQDAQSFSEVLQQVMAERGADSAAPLSAEQKRLWLLGGLATGSWAVTSARYRIPGTTNPAELQLRLATLVSRHEALRSVFVDVAGRPARLVLPFAEAPMRTVADADRQDQPGIEELVRHTTEEEFAIGHGPLLRVLLLSAADGEAELVLAGHRLVLDSTSLDLLAAELLGDDIAENDDALSAALAAEREGLAADGLAEQLTGWAAQLAR